MSDRALARLVQHIEHLVRRTAQRAATEALVPVVRQLVLGAFRDHRSPTGSTWPARAEPSAHPPLVASGRLRGAFVVSATPDGVRVDNRTPYAAVHQRGARLRRGRRRQKRGKHRRLRPALALGAKLPARPMLPTTRWGPPATKRLKAAAFHAVRVLLGINRR